MADKVEHLGTELPGEPDKTNERARQIGRFAQYTSPVMLAMLVSTGNNAAFAASIPP
jgi:hypothetical protein